MNSSNKSAVSVTFSITLDYQQFIPENELNDPNSPYLDMIRNANTIEGAINLSTPGQPDVHFRDILAPWVQNLCFRGIGQLIDGQPLKVNYFGRSGSADFIPQNSIIVVKTETNPETNYAKSSLLHELVNFGSRFILFAEKIKKDDPDYMANINYIKSYEPLAYKALKQFDLS